MEWNDGHHLLQLRLSLYYWQCFPSKYVQESFVFESKESSFSSLKKYLAIIFSVWFFSDAYKDIWNHLHSVLCLILFSMSLNLLLFFHLILCCTLVACSGQLLKFLILSVVLTCLICLVSFQCHDYIFNF